MNFNRFELFRLTTLSNVGVTVEYLPKDMFTNASSEPTKEQLDAAIRLCQDAIVRLEKMRMQKE